MDYLLRPLEDTPYEEEDGGRDWIDEALANGFVSRLSLYV
jgi:hypothetical protein